MDLEINCFLYNIYQNYDLYVHLILLSNFRDLGLTYLPNNYIENKGFIIYDLSVIEY